MIELVTSGAYSADSFVAQHVFERQHFQIGDCDFLERYAAGNAERNAREDLEICLLAPRDYGATSKEDFYQSCFGVPGIIVSDSPVCAVCPQREECELARQVVLSKSLSETGFADPIAEADRRENRRRVNKYRARQRTLKSENNAAPALEVTV